MIEDHGGAGHVAIVEEINEQTGEITCSNSEYQGRYFFITYITPVNNKYDWGTNYAFQGFIYNPFITPTPPTPTEIKKRKFPWAIYSRILRAKRGQ